MIGIIRTKDLRNEYLKDFFKEDRYIYSDKITELYNLDILVLSFPGIDSSNYIKNTNINLKEVIEQNRSLRLIVTGSSNKELENVCTKYNISLIVLMKSKQFVAKNAMLTSEGLLRVISNDIDKSIRNLDILVLGYGFVGESIVNDLNHYCNVSIYSIDPKEQKSILLSKNNLIKDLNNIKYDIVINTVPVNILSKDKLLNDEVKIYDVSSYPYGFDESLNNYVKIVPQIPGNILPKSAAKIIFDEIKQEISKL